MVAPYCALIARGGCESFRSLARAQRYLDHIQKYADGSARSKVGNAVRRGVAAHEFDDIIDDHGSEARPQPASS
jgi:hypothetical protein